MERLREEGGRGRNEGKWGERGEGEEMRREMERERDEERREIRRVREMEER